MKINVCHIQSQLYFYQKNILTVIYTIIYNLNKKLSSYCIRISYEVKSNRKSTI